LTREWTEFEVEAVVTDYFAMLLKELRGEGYSKTKHREGLMRLLDDRSNGSVEFKHQNISAILIELGFPYIEGYKPRWNYQTLLAQAVRARLATSTKLERAVRTAVDAAAAPVSLSGLVGREEDPPAVTNGAGHTKAEHEPGTFLVSWTVNYLEREAANRSLGRMGETFALEFERARLREFGKERLARQVDHVAVTRGDGLGYDILSFEVDGSDRLIEVKTTGFGKQTPFFVSRNELRVSQAKPEFHLYRVFAYRANPRLFILRGALDRVCRLQPTQYVAGLGA
jgi:hypothetical protein